MEFQPIEGEPCASDKDLPKRNVQRLGAPALRFRGLGCGKFSISVWLGAQGTCVQFTSLSDRCATGITGHGQYLFRSEFLGLHNRIMQLATAGKMLNIAQFFK